MSQVSEKNITSKLSKEEMELMLDLDDRLIEKLSKNFLFPSTFQNNNLPELEEEEEEVLLEAARFLEVESADLRRFDPELMEEARMESVDVVEPTCLEALLVPLQQSFPVDPASLSLVENKDGGF